jgi:hypothetical protein
MPDFDGLIGVLFEARQWLACQENDFSWSSWDDAFAALAAVDGLISELRLGSMPPKLDLEALFAPTGPIQEVSLSSGWGEQFLSLASRLEDELTQLAQANPGLLP